MQRLYVLPVIVLFLFGLACAEADDTDTASVKLFKVQQYLAKSGDAAGQYYLAEMYEKGLGTPQNLDQALIWYKKSAELGNTKAEEKLANWEKNQENALKIKERADFDAKAADLAVKQREEAAAAAKARAAADLAHKEQARAAELAKAKQEEAEAAKAAKARAAEAARKATAEPAMPKTTTTTTSGPTDAKNPASGQAPAAKGKATKGADSTESKDSDQEGFNSNPCTGPQAKFLSTCHRFP